MQAVGRARPWRTAITGLALGALLLCAACTGQASIEPGAAGSGTVTPAIQTTPSVPPAVMSATAIAPGLGGCEATTVPTTASPSDLTLVARNIQFDEDALTAAGTSFVLIYQNDDDGIEHNLHVLGPHGETVCHPAAFAGVANQAYAFSSLDPGVYTFHCDLHLAAMQGRLTVP
jgi:plastocyanin